MIEPSRTTVTTLACRILREPGRGALILASTAVLGARAGAQEQAPEDRRHELAAPTPEGDSILSWERATGPWFGARPWLAEHGVEAELLWTSDLSWVARGGLEPGATPFRNLFDLVLTADTGKLVDVEGGNLLIDFQLFTGVNGSDDVGDIQGFSNIDASDEAQLAKLWWEQHWWDDALSARIGKMDANSLFAWTLHGARFLNSSMGYSPTIFALPSYPKTVFGLVVAGEPTRGVRASAGVFDGDGGTLGPETLIDGSGALFMIGEVDVSWSDDDAPGRVGVGVWTQTGELARFDGGVQQGTSGAYLVLDQSLWSGPSERRLGAFLQLGLANPDVSEFSSHVGAGLEWVGPFPRRPADATGLGFTWAGLSDEPGAGFETGGELALETFYSFLATPWLRLKPDLQYIIDPGGSATVANALVFTLRATVAF